MLDEMAEAESPTAHSRALRVNESGQSHLNPVRKTTQVSEQIGCVLKVSSNSLPKTLRLETKKAVTFHGLSSFDHLRKTLELTR